MDEEIDFGVDDIDFVDDVDDEDDDYDGVHSNVRLLWHILNVLHANI